MREERPRLRPLRGSGGKYASCRPIYVEQAVRDAGYQIVSRDESVVAGLFPLKLLVATPG